MRAFKPGIAIVAVTVAVALPATALAEGVVPPGNSAANQYTETAPSAGGEQLPPGGHSTPPTPAKALGAKAADQLDRLGPVGRAAAVLAAAGAPRQIGSDREGRAGNGGRGRDQASPPARDRPGADPAGSSGFGQILGQATGLSSGGGSSLLLVLAIAATCLWAAAYVWRHRGRAV